MGIFFLLLFGCLGIGILGYHYFANIPWLDSLHNASMILSGMGPVADVKTVAGKWFSSFYALFSGVAFITNIGFLLTPVVHRFFHGIVLNLGRIAAMDSAQQLIFDPQVRAAYLGY